MSNELGEIYGTVKHGKSCIILDSNTIDVSGNLTTQGHIQFIHSNYQIAGADPSGILTRLDNLDNILDVSAGTVRASSAVIVDGNKDISGFRKIGIGTTSPSEKLVVEDGSILIGNNSNYAYGGNTYSDNFSGHRLKFDSTFNGWKIVMYNSNSSVYGFGVSEYKLTYYASADHVFYTGSTSTANGSGRETLRIVNNDHRPLRIQTTPLNKNCIITQDSNRSSANSFIGGLDGKWDGTTIASMFIMSGSNNTDKNNGYIKFHTTNNGGDLYNTNTERLRITADGNVGIGTADPNEKLHVNGNILASGNITAYSDIRFKKNILKITSPLKKICAMRGVEYTRIESEEKEIGVIAQEVEKIVPELVKITNIKDNNDSSELQNIRSMKYGNCVGLLIEGIKEQQMQIEDLKKEIIKIKNLN